MKYNIFTLESIIAPGKILNISYHIPTALAPTNSVMMD